MPLDIAIYLSIIAIGVTAYLLGHRDGYRKGYDSGFVRGHHDGQRKWIAAMENRRLGADGKDALLRVIQPTRDTR